MNLSESAYIKIVFFKNEIYVFLSINFIYTTLFIVFMAKPIRATPTLRGEDARRFMRGVLEEQKNPSKARIELLQEAAQVTFNLPQ